MTIWRPANFITVKALALIWQVDALLLTEIYDDHGNVKGMRPLGGTVEFGEAWRDTLQREFLEELGARISLGTDHFVLENIYEHYGQTGHEIVFLCHAHFSDGRFYRQDAIPFLEHDETECIARWMSVAELKAKQIELYPEGLMERLTQPVAGSAVSRRYS
ncbi:NUDIX hydrolase [Roseibium sp. MB-4]